MEDAAPPPLGTFRRSSDTATTWRGGSAFVVRLSSSEVFRLNGGASRIWSALRSPSTVAALSIRLRSTYPEAAAGDVEALVEQFIEDLVERRLAVEAVR